MLQRSLLSFSEGFPTSCLVCIGYFGIIHSAFIWRALIVFIFNAVNELLLVTCVWREVGGGGGACRGRLILALCQHQ